MHIRTKLLGMMIFAALAGAVLVFNVFFLQREIATSAGREPKANLLGSWYNLYSNAVLDIGDIMVAITSFGSELDVEENIQNFQRRLRGVQRALPGE